MHGEVGSSYQLYQIEPPTILCPAGKYRTDRGNILSRVRPITGMVATIYSMPVPTPFMGAALRGGHCRDINAGRLQLPRLGVHESGPSRALSTHEPTLSQDHD
jgi:hypothetical protein